MALGNAKGSPMASRHSERSQPTGRAPERVAAIEISVEQTAGLRMINVLGELDLSTAVHLDDALGAARADPLDLIIDLQRTDFLDCAGVHPLANAATTQAGAGRSFAIACAPHSQPARLFQTLATSGIDLPVHHSRADALLAALTSPDPATSSPQPSGP